MNMIRKKPTIRMNLIFFFTALILSALFMFLGISIQVTEDTVLENSTQYTRQLVTQVSSDIDNYINYMENISTMLATNVDIREYLSSSTLDKYREQELYNRILFQFDNILNMRNDIYNLAIYGENDKYVLNRGNDIINPYVDVKNMEWYAKAVEGNGKRILSSSHVQNLIYDDYKWVVTLSKAIREKEKDRVIGALLVDLNYSSITNLCQNIDLGNKGYIFLIDESGDVIYHPKQQLVYTEIKREKISDILSCKGDHFITEVDNEQKLYAIATSEKTGWKVVGVANINELFAKKEETKQIYFTYAFFLIFAAVVTAVLFSKRITQPIIELRNSMKEVEKGNFITIKIKENDNSEIGMLKRSFNIMTQEIHKLMNDKVLIQKEKRKQEIKALQAQINPHFLYNTLDSIIWMAEGGENKEVVVMTSSLAKLLRQSISNEEELVTIQSEISYVKSYLTIQKMRYKDQLNYHIDVDPAIYPFLIVKLTLQPLVENAIYHGIKYKESEGNITIKGYQNDNNIFLQVIDDGIGMDEETLRHIFDKKETDRSSNGIAVENVNRRLRLYYGEEYELKYESEMNKGTTVTIILPKKEGGNQDGE